MDIFDVLKAVSKRKLELASMNEKDALKKAELDVSKEFNIRLHDIESLYRPEY